jgi:hypothetical protein
MPEIQKICVAMICYGRWWLPSQQRAVDVPGNVRVLDMPGDAEFVKNTGYGPCGLPGQIWDEHADNHDDKPGWLCKWHAEADGSCLPPVFLQDLLEDQKG